MNAHSYRTGDAPADRDADQMLPASGRHSEAPAPAGRSFRERITDAAAMFLVSALSLLLLLYVAFGNARKNFETMHIEKLVTQGQFIQSALESYLRPGLPMRLYVGFSNLVEPMVEADPAIVAIEAIDKDERQIFISGNRAISAKGADTSQPIREGVAKLARNDGYTIVTLPLRNKFETVGSLRLYMPREHVDNLLKRKFISIAQILGGLAIAFTVFVFLFGPGRSESRDRWFGITFAVTYLIATTFVVTTMIGVYSEGAQARSKALADSLGQRIDDVVTFKLSFDDMDGLAGVLKEYRRLNPEVGAVAVTVDGKVVVHSDEKYIGKTWVTDHNTFEYAVDLAPKESLRPTRVIVTMPRDFVIAQVLGSVKNFAALFVAAAFFAAIFMQVASSSQRAMERALGGDERAVNRDASLVLVKPVFFLAVCIEHLSYAFLPQFVQSLTLKAGLPYSWASLPFMAYYLCFALALMPAGRYETRIGPRPLILGGLLLSALGLVTIAWVPEYVAVLAARCVSGIGQGMLFIGVQSYILATVSADRKTQGASIIVFGFQGGMISGMAIGSLLVTQLQPSGIFHLGAGTAIAVMLYSALAVPKTAPVSTGQAMPESSWDIWREIGQMLRNGHFFKTIMLIGVPAKAVLTGVVFFALPLLLAKSGFAQEDIGQITMVYAGSVIIAGIWAAKLADRTGRTTSILFWGSTISAIGLGTLSILGMSPDITARSVPIMNGLIVLAAVIIIGIAHGMINAPVITHVTEGELAGRIGAGSVAAAYRFLERLGHMLGPIIVGQLFAMAGQTAAVFAWIAGAILVMGLLFLINAGPANNRVYGEEFAR
jgi:predicted MFS family arabinose efflux permease